MKRIKNLSESNFLKLFFAFFSAAFLAAAFFMPDRGTMLADFWQILSQPSKLTTSCNGDALKIIGRHAAQMHNRIGFDCLNAPEHKAKGGMRIG